VFPRTLGRKFFTGGVCCEFDKVRILLNPTVLKVFLALLPMKCMALCGKMGAVMAYAHSWLW
jgi:hypothetical protein